MRTIRLRADLEAASTHDLLTILAVGSGDILTAAHKWILVSLSHFEDGYGRCAPYDPEELSDKCGIPRSDFGLVHGLEVEGFLTVEGTVELAAVAETPTIRSRPEPGEGWRDSQGFAKLRGAGNRGQEAIAAALVACMMERLTVRPSPRTIGKQAAAAKRLAAAENPRQLCWAVLGIEHVFPFSSGAAWDLMDLERKFGHAVEAAVATYAKTEAGASERLDRLRAASR